MLSDRRIPIRFFVVLAATALLVGANISRASLPAVAGSSLPAPSSTGTRPLAPPGQATNTCATCHANLSDPKLREPATAYAGSVHQGPRVGCVGCHHGDPRDPTVGAHRAAGFDPHPAHAEIARICSNCHS